MPAVSVIIPSYNHAAYLKERIDSILSQTFQDFEVIILDDCSTDNSRNIIEIYRNHPKISQIIYNEVNSGSVFHQWIRGIELSKGEYIWIAESDDYADPLFLQKTYNKIIGHNETGLVFTNSYVVNEKGEVLKDIESGKKLPDFAKLKKANHIINSHNLTSFLIKTLVIDNASSVLFRKKSLISVDLNFLKTLINAGDRFVYIGICLNFNLHYLPETLNFMRSHENNTTKTNLKNGKLYNDRLRVLNYYVNKFNLVGETKKDLNFFLNSYFLHFVDHGKTKEINEVLKKMYLRQIIVARKYMALRIYLFFCRNLLHFQPRFVHYIKKMLTFGK